MRDVYIITFTNPTSPAPSYYRKYFTEKEEVESYLREIEYLPSHGILNKYHSKSDKRYCAHVISFYK